MSDKSQMGCDQCNASYIVDIFSLGHTERDGLQCDCCGAWILRKRSFDSIWQRSAASVMIVST